MSEELFPVTSLDEGQEAVVRLLSGGENLTGRLAAMGIIPGTRIKLLRKSLGEYSRFIVTLRGVGYRFEV